MVLMLVVLVLALALVLVLALMLVLCCAGVAGAGAGTAAAGAGTGGAGAVLVSSWIGMEKYWSSAIIRCRGNALPESRFWHVYTVSCVYIWYMCISLCVIGHLWFGETPFMMCMCTFGFAAGRQLKSFWLVFFRTGRTTLLVSWLGAWSDAMTGASIARPWTSLPRCNRTFLPWPYNLFCLEACTLHRGQRVSFRSWKHTFEDLAFDSAASDQVHIWPGSIW